MKRIKYALLIGVCVFFSCISAVHKTNANITFSLIAIGEKPYCRQSLDISDSLVIDTMRTLQICHNEIFVHKLDMDWYVFHIAKINRAGDSLITFIIDKEVYYESFASGGSLDWRKIDHSDYWYNKTITIKKDTTGLLWDLLYDDTIQRLKLISNEDIKKSGFPILLYEDCE